MVFQCVLLLWVAVGILEQQFQSMFRITCFTPPIQHTPQVHSSLIPQQQYPLHLQVVFPSPPLGLSALWQRHPSSIHPSPLNVTQVPDRHCPRS